MTVIEPQAIGTPVPRVEGPAKVVGSARYAAEQPVTAPLYLRGVPATIAHGTVTDVDTAAAEALPGVVAVLTHATAPRMADTSDPELAVLQSDRVHHRGQYVAAVLAESSETARHAASLVRVTYAEEDATTAFDEHSPDLYTPPRVLFFPADTVTGDPEAALDAAAVTVRATYRTPAQHHNPMEPHASIACWSEDGNGLTLYESTQSVTDSRETIAGLFGVDADDVSVICPHVGGGFGSKGSRHAASALTVLAARAVPGRAVHCALDRDEMFATTGYRAATVQHVTLAADRDGRLDVLAHDVVEPTARMKEFAEPTAVYSRHLYAARNRRTSHRLLAMDVNVPTYMRAPGEAPGSFGAESAMDELAVALGMDPVELRVRNEPDADPDTGLPFSTRNLVACLRHGAERFGWSERDPLPRNRLVDGWWHGTGVAASFFPAMRMPGSTAVIRFDGYRYAVLIGAADIGQGARTVLTQIAADALRVPHDRIDVAIGDTALPHATMAGGSTGTNSWGTAVVDAAERFRDKFGDDPDDGDEADGAATDNPWAAELAMGAYGAHFVEVAVHADTGEIRVPRMLGVFAVGQVLNPTTARSQIVGGMTWGLSMALHEESVLDPRTGHWVNHDLAGYHVPVHADIGEIDVEWVDEKDPYVNPMGAKGIGEIGIVGSAAAIANAAFHATGVRVRSLPITLDDFLVSDEFVGAAGERR